jgi:hypothetical protein
MPCHAMPCYAMLCYAVLCHAMLCYDVCYAMLCPAARCTAPSTTLPLPTIGRAPYGRELVSPRQPRPDPHPGPRARGRGARLPAPPPTLHTTPPFHTPRAPNEASARLGHTADGPARRLTCMQYNLTCAPPTGDGPARRAATGGWFAPHVGRCAADVALAAQVGRREP